MHWRATERAVKAVCHAKGLPVDVAETILHHCLVGHHAGRLWRGPVLREVVTYNPKEGGTLCCGCNLAECLMQNHDFAFHWLPRRKPHRSRQWSPTLALVTSSTYLRHDVASNPQCWFLGRRTLVCVRFLPLRNQRGVVATKT